jgi:hypothetical protein
MFNKGKRMIHFLTITIQEKAGGPGDYRAFLNFGDDEDKMVYQIRGYGLTPGQAADDAYNKFLEDPFIHYEDEWEWK